MPKENFNKLGELVHEFQRLDIILDYFIHGLLTLPKKHSDLIISEMSFKSKINLLSCLGADLLSSEDFTILKTIFKEVEKCEIKRNEFLHSHWFNFSKDLIKMKKSAKQRGFRYDMEMVKDVDFDLIISNIRDVASKAGELMSDLELKLNRPHLSPLMASEHIDFSHELPLNAIREYFQNLSYLGQ